MWPIHQHQRSKICAALNMHLPLTWEHKDYKYTNPANPVRNFCKQKLAAPPSTVWFGAL